MHDIRRDLTRNVLAVSCVAGLIALSVWVLRPFLAAGVWAAMIVVATWPPFLALEQRLGGRRSLAIAAMCVGMLLFLVLPLWLTIDTLVTHSHDIAALGQRLLDKVEAAQVRVAGGKVGKGTFVEQPAQQPL